MTDVHRGDQRDADEDPRRGAPPEIVGPYLAGVLGDDGWAECEVSSSRAARAT